MTNVKAVWWEVWYEGSDRLRPVNRLDARRRSKATAEKVAEELRSSGNYVRVWLVEVNRLKRSPV